MTVLRPAGGVSKNVQDWLDARAKDGYSVRSQLSEDLASGEVTTTEKRYTWDESHGELAEVRAFSAMGVLMTPDCELDKPRKRVLVTFARIKPVLADMAIDAVQTMKDRNQYRAFYLAPQTDPALPECYIDFASLTTFTLDSLPADQDGRFLHRHLSMHDDVRDAMRNDFAEYLTADRDEGDA